MLQSALRLHHEERKNYRTSSRVNTVTSAPDDLRQYRVISYHNDPEHGYVYQTYPG